MKTPEFDKSKLLFSNRELRLLLVPLVIEQVLNSLMGTFDTIMVSNVGSAAISAVSLVDSINILVMQVFSALAAGGTIVCAQYLGKKEPKECNHAAKQLFFVMALISVAMMVFCIVLRDPLLRLIFGQIEADVMEAAQIYFRITAISFPFIALFNANAAFFRSEGNSRLPMIVSVICNGINIGGNAVMIFGLHMGVRGAALATLISRVVMAVVMIIMQRRDKQVIVIRHYAKIRPQWSVIKIILAVGIPTGIEGGMFQFGKLAIQSTVSTLGTTAIAAQAMTIVLENLNGVAGIGIGIGLMTVVGRCMGAGEKGQAIYYIKKVTAIAWVTVLSTCLLIFALTKPMIIMGGMEAEAAKMCFWMMSWITIVKPIVWTFGFVPGYGLRAAGDVRYSMIMSTLVMWLCRVTLAIFLMRFTSVGPMGVWIGMFADWTARGIFYGGRFHRGKWLEHKVV